MKLRLDDIHTKPQDWLAHMEKQKNELINACYIMDGESYLTYVLASLPQEEPQTMILVLKEKVRRGTLMIEETENLLNYKFEAMTELNGWCEDVEEHTLVVQEPQLKKIFKWK